MSQELCECGKSIDPTLKASCLECFTAMKARYRKEIIAEYGHEVLSKEAHLLELQEAVEKFLEEANRGYPWSSMDTITGLTQALADSKKTRPKKT